MSSFEFTKQFESITENVNGQSGFRNEASLCDPRSNEIIGSMNQGNKLDMFPSADSLLSGFPSGDQNPMQQLTSSAIDASSSIGNKLDLTNGSDGGGILAGLNDLTGGEAGKLSGELNDLSKCSGVDKMLSGSGLDQITGGSGGDSSQSGGGLGGLLGEVVPAVAKALPAVAGLAALL